jgi:ABC-type branched-subunit amino acid transport system ATPase component
MVAPDSGEILLGEEDITALKPFQRVRRGLARTFQINTLFPHLSALESVTLSVLERDGHAHNWWRGLPAFSSAADEAAAILKSLHLEKVLHRETRELAYGSSACSRSRSRWRRGRECCSTSRRVPKGESLSCSPRSKACRAS